MTTATRILIVNADDFGAGNGVNTGIIEAHRQGIVTSTSLMLHMPGTEAAVGLAHQHPALSVGLHVNLTGEGTPPRVELGDTEACRAEITHQLERFTDLLGRPPTHLDAHHNIHRLDHLEPLFVAAARAWGLRLREHCDVHYFPDFYGQWDDGDSHPEWISPSNLIRMLDEDIGPGVTELSCHPGRFDPELASSYHLEREVELATLCDPSIRAHLERAGIRLVGYAQLPALGSRP